MRKIVIALLIATAVALSGVSAATFTSGQLTNSAWADGGGM